MRVEVYRSAPLSFHLLYAYLRTRADVPDIYPLNGAAANPKAYAPCMHPMTTVYSINTRYTVLQLVMYAPCNHVAPSIVSLIPRRPHATWTRAPQSGLYSPDDFVPYRKYCSIPGSLHLRGYYRPHNDYIIVGGQKKKIALVLFFN